MVGLTEAMVILGALAGGFINGLAGFGTALFALGFFLTVMPPAEAVGIVVLISIVSGVQGLWVVRQAIFARPRRMLRFMLPGLAGIPFGVAALAHLDAEALKLVIAVFLLVYGGYFSLRSTLPRFERPTPVIDMGVGLAGGVLGGAAALSGALPTMWCSMRPWPKAETRAVLQPFNMAILSVTALMLWWKGVYDQTVLLHTALAIPATLLAAQAGIMIFGRLGDESFRRLLISMCLVSGLILLGRALL